MNGLEITVTLGAAVFAGTVLAPRLRMATPLLLLLLGLVLGFLPELRHIELHPEMVLLIFLPVMLFWESLTHVTAFDPARLPRHHDHEHAAGRRYRLRGGRHRARPRHPVGSG